MRSDDMSNAVLAQLVAEVYSAEDLGRYLRAAAERAAGSLSSPQYDALRLPDWPSARTVMRRLGAGSWASACLVAGVESGRPFIPASARATTTDALRSAAADTGGELSRPRYWKWRAAQAHPESWPSLKRCTPAEWRDLCRDAGVTEAFGRPSQLLPDNELVEALHRAAADLGPLSVAGYAQWRRGQIGRGVKVPSVATVLARFGSWTNACRVAGVLGARRYLTRGELVEAIQEAAVGVGPGLSAREYDRWAKEEGAGRPVASTVISRFGSWIEALETAGLGRPRRGQRA